MIEHISIPILNKLKHRKLLIIYCCDDSTMGPKGLILLVYSSKHSYVANLSRINEDGYKQLIEKVFIQIPKLQILANNRLSKDIPIEKCYTFIYFGCGSGAFVNKSLAKEFNICDFKSFKDVASKPLDRDPLVLSLSDNSWKEENNYE